MQIPFHYSQILFTRIIFEFFIIQKLLRLLFLPTIITDYRDNVSKVQNFLLHSATLCKTIFRSTFGGMCTWNKKRKFHGTMNKWLPIAFSGYDCSTLISKQTLMSNSATSQWMKWLFTLLGIKSWNVQLSWEFCWSEVSRIIQGTCCRRKLVELVEKKGLRLARM